MVQLDVSEEGHPLKHSTRLVAVFGSEQEWYLFLLVHRYASITKSIAVSGTFCIRLGLCWNMQRTPRKKAQAKTSGRGIKGALGKGLPGKELGQKAEARTSTSAILRTSYLCSIGERDRGITSKDSIS